MKTSAEITQSLRKEDAQHDWWVIDAESQTLGRLATKAATLIRGKHKPSFTPHVDCGDFVVIINASKVQISSKRKGLKEYFSHSGYLGKGKVRGFVSMIEKNPQFVIHHAVKGMLPKNKLGNKLATKLKVYPGAEHAHAAQQPKALDF